MSFFSRVRTEFRVRTAGAGDTPRMLEFTERDPAENVFLSYLLRRDGLERGLEARSWVLAERDREVCGVCLASGNVVPAVAGEEVARALAEAIAVLRSGTRSLVGERSAVNAMWEVLRRRAPAVRLVREEQPFYVLNREGFARAGGARAPALRLREAKSEDLDLLVAASADMLREEILDDPYGRDPVAFRAQVWRMIQERAIYVGEEKGRVIFKAHANVRTPLAAQVSGVYTLPPYRGKGHARAGMRLLAQRLLADHPRLCLYVNLENAAAIRAYEACGFRRAGTFKSIFFESRD
jgi:predicted GNAT family acetyltransferase